MESCSEGFSIPVASSRAREGSGGFGRAMAARRDQSVAVGELKVNLTFAKRSGVPRLVGLRQRGQQRLRLGDLRHFWGRRKALERGCKHGVRVGVAARRTIELRERERGAQLEAARLLGL